MRKVMIATPSYDGKVYVNYVDALLNTVRSAPQDLQIAPVFIPGDAMIQRVRNDLIKIAVETKVDDMVWIDADIVWAPEDFYKLLSNEKHFVSGMYSLKTENIVMCFKPKEGFMDISKGETIETNGVGLGFCKMDSYCINKLWENSKPYKIGPTENRLVFEVTLDENNEFTGEDITTCFKWIALDEKVYLDTSILCGHIGVKQYPSITIKGVKNE